MLRFNVIAFTHHSIGLEEIGQFHLEEDKIAHKMRHIKEQMNIEELMYVSTCNRVEFIFVTPLTVSESFISHFLNEFNADWKQDQIEMLIENAKIWNGINAVNHLIEVASSLDSMVIGEREIITQLKDAYEFANVNKLAGDTIRIVMKQVILTAKKVYTDTGIATKPVSVVSLAYHQLSERNLSLKSRVVFIGAGVTNTNMARFLHKHGFRNFTIFNRSLENAETLGKMVDGDAYTLKDIKEFKEGFDILVCCTGASDSIVTSEVYTALLNGEKTEKVIIDLAIPADLDKTVQQNHSIDLISVDYLKSISDINLKARKKELIKVRQIIFDSVEEFKQIFKMRQIEVKMRAIPEKVKEIKAKALSEVFSKDLEKLDDEGREVVEKILNYMEKKYVSVPMIMAKEIVKTNGFENEN